MYTGNKARIITDRKGKYIEVKKEVKQGEPMSPVLFNSTVEQFNDK